LACRPKTTDSQISAIAVSASSPKPPFADADAQLAVADVLDLPRLEFLRASLRDQAPSVEDRDPATFPNLACRVDPGRAVGGCGLTASLIRATGAEDLPGRKRCRTSGSEARSDVPVVADRCARRTAVRPQGGNLTDVSEPRFHFVCAASALVGVPAGWLSEMLTDGEIAFLADSGGFDTITEIAHMLGLISVPLLRREETVEHQQETVMAFAERLPLVWVDENFGETATAWARDRGPMTLLVHATGPLAEDERRRIERFVASLGRQAE